MTRGSKTSGRRRSRAWFIVVVVAVAALIGLRALSRSQSRQHAALAALVADRPTVEVQSREMSQYVPASGKLEPARTSVVGVDSPAKVTAVKVKEGSRVSSGKVLAEVVGMAGPAELKAPFAGLVGQAAAEEGSYVQPGMPLFTIMDTSSYYAGVSIDEIDLLKVSVGMPAKVTFDAAPGVELDGEVTWVGSSAQRMGDIVTVPVRVSVADKGQPLVPGITAHVRIKWNTREGVTAIPSRAWVELDDKNYAIVVEPDGHSAHLAQVTLGISDGYSVEVIEGLTVGDTIVEDAVSVQDKLPGAGGRKLFMGFHPGSDH